MHWICSIFELTWAVVLKGWGRRICPMERSILSLSLFTFMLKIKSRWFFISFIAFKFSTNNAPLILGSRGDYFHSLLLECSSYMVPHIGMVFDFYNGLHVHPNVEVIRTKSSRKLKKTWCYDTGFWYST